MTYTRGRESRCADAGAPCRNPPRRPDPAGRVAAARPGRARRPRLRPRPRPRVASQGAVRAVVDRRGVGTARRRRNAPHDARGGDPPGARLLRLPDRCGPLRAARSGASSVGSRRDRLGAPGPGPVLRKRRGRPARGDRRARAGAAAGRSAGAHRAAPRRARSRHLIGHRDARSTFRGGGHRRESRDHGEERRRRCAWGGAAARSDECPGAAHRARRRRLGHHRSAPPGREVAAPQAAHRGGDARADPLVRPDDLAPLVDDDRHRRRAGRARGRRLPGDRAAERPAHPDHQPLPQGEGALEHPRRRRDDERLRRLVGLVPGGTRARFPGLQSPRVRVAAAAAARQAVAARDRLAGRLFPAEGGAAPDGGRSARSGHPSHPAPRRDGDPDGARRGTEGADRLGAGGAPRGAGPGGAGAVDPDRHPQLRAGGGRPRGAARRSHRRLLRRDRHDGTPLSALHAAPHGDLPGGGLRALPGRRHRLLRLAGPAARRGPRRRRSGDDGGRPLRPRLPLGGRAAEGRAPLHHGAAGRVARQGGDLPHQRPGGAARRPAHGDADAVRHCSDDPGAARAAGVRRHARPGDRGGARSVLPGASSGAAHPVLRDGRRAARAGAGSRGSGGARGGGGAAREPAIARLHRRRRRSARAGGGCGGGGFRGGCPRGRHAGLLPPQPRDLFPQAPRLRAGHRGAEAGERAPEAPEDRRDAGGGLARDGTSGRGRRRHPGSARGASGSRPRTGAVARAPERRWNRRPRGGTRHRRPVRAAHGEEAGARRRHRGMPVRGRGSPERRAGGVPPLARRRSVAGFRRGAPVRARVAGRPARPPAPGAPAVGRPRSPGRRRLEPHRHDRSGVGRFADRARGVPAGERPGPGRGPLRRESRRRVGAPRALGRGGRGVRAGAPARAFAGGGVEARLGVPAAGTTGGGARGLRTRPRAGRLHAGDLPGHGAGAGGAGTAPGGAALGRCRARAPSRRGVSHPAQERDRSARSRSAASRCTGSSGSVRAWTSW